MTQDILLLIVRLFGVLLTLLILRYTLRFYRYRRKIEETRFSKEGSCLARNDAELNKTSRLNPGFLGKQQNLPPLADTLPDAPTSNFIVSIMARSGQHFSGEDINKLVHTFGLQRSPSGIYELINENGRDILFSMLNIHRPGVFTENLADMESIDGVLIIMQLPNCNDAVKDYETFFALVKEMTESCNGRLCNQRRRPINEKDLLKYRQMAESFQQNYETWLAHHQSQY